MKKILTLFAACAAAFCVSAQTLGVDYTWKPITTAAVPEDFFEGVSTSAAQEYLAESFLYEGAICGFIPFEGDEYDAVFFNSDWEWEAGTTTWAAAYQNGFYVYPAAYSGEPGEEPGEDGPNPADTVGAPKEGIDFQWVEVTSEMTAVPEDFFEGLNEAVARFAMADHIAFEGVVYGNLPTEESGEFQVVAFSWDTYAVASTLMTWAGIVEYGWIYYPQAIGGTDPGTDPGEDPGEDPNQPGEESALGNVDARSGIKTLRDGQLIIRRGSEEYNVLGIRLR